MPANLEQAWLKLKAAWPKPLWRTLEALAIFGVYGWVAVGAQQFIAENGYGIDKLLELLEFRWKAALLLAAILFHRTLRDLIDRLRDTPFGKLAPPEPVLPLGPPTERAINEPTEGESP